MAEAPPELPQPDACRRRGRRYSPLTPPRRCWRIVTGRGRGHWSTRCSMGKARKPKADDASTPAIPPGVGGGGDGETTGRYIIVFKEEAAQDVKAVKAALSN